MKLCRPFPDPLTPILDFLKDACRHAEFKVRHLRIRYRAGPAWLLRSCG